MSNRCWFLLLLFASTAFGQVKVGTTGAQFLEITPSARSAGMGGVGVMLTDSYSSWHNPASLGLMEMRRGALSFSPIVLNPANPDIEFRAYSLSARLTSQSPREKTRWVFSFALSRVHLSSGDMIERTYGEGTFDGTEITFSWDDYCDQISLATAYSRKVELAFGISLKLIRSYTHDYSAEAGAVDVGGLIRIPLAGAGARANLLGSGYSHKIAIGAAFRNVGGDMTFIDRSYPLPIRRSIGVGWEIKYFKSGRPNLEITPALEYWGGHDSDLLQWSQAGLEVGFMESIYVRTGEMLGPDDTRVTCGIGLSSERLRMDAPNSQTNVSFLTYLRQNLVVKLDYGRLLSTDRRSASDYFAVSILL